MYSPTLSLLSFFLSISSVPSFFISFLSIAYFSSCLPLLFLYISFFSLTPALVKLASVSLISLIFFLQSLELPFFYCPSLFLKSFILYFSPSSIHLAFLSPTISLSLSLFTFSFLFSPLLLSLSLLPIYLLLFLFSNIFLLFHHPSLFSCLLSTFFSKFNLFFSPNSFSYRSLTRVHFTLISPHVPRIYARFLLFSSSPFHFRLSHSLFSYTPPLIIILLPSLQKAPITTFPSDAYLALNQNISSVGPFFTFGLFLL